MKRLLLVIGAVVLVLMGISFGVTVLASGFLGSDGDADEAADASPTETTVPPTELPTTARTTRSTAPAPTGTPTAALTPTPTATPTPTRTSTATPIPTPTPTPSPTATATPAPTPTPTATPTPARQMDLNRSELERAVMDEINVYRSENGLDELQNRGNTVETITAMGRNHSRELRADGQAWNLSSDYDIEGLYRSYGLYESCKFLTNGGGGVIKPDNGRMMAVHRIEVDREDESYLAQRIVDYWDGHRFHGDKLDYENAEQVGVGLAMDHDEDAVYVAMSVC